MSTDSTLSQVARKMADSRFALRCIHQDSHGKVKMIACHRCVESAIREAMLLALQKAERLIKEHCHCEENNRNSCIFESLERIQQLKSELIPSTSPDEKGNL